jgi:hypothetical protein
MAFFGIDEELLNLWFFINHYSPPPIRKEAAKRGGQPPTYRGSDSSDANPEHDKC